MRAINAAIDKGNEQLLLEVLKDQSAALYNVVPGNTTWYMKNLKEEKAAKAQVYCLADSGLLMFIYNANVLCRITQEKFQYHVV